MQRVGGGRLAQLLAAGTITRECSAAACARERGARLAREKGLLEWARERKRGRHRSPAPRARFTTRRGGLMDAAAKISELELQLRESSLAFAAPVSFFFFPSRATRIPAAVLVAMSSVVCWSRFLLYFTTDWCALVDTAKFEKMYLIKIS